MADTLTTGLELTKPGVAEAAGRDAWGGKLNTDLDMIDEALTTVVSKAVTTADVTLTDQESRAGILVTTGALTANRNLIVATKRRRYIAINNNTGAFTLTVKTSAGSGVTIPQGAASCIYCDGTNVLKLYDIPVGNGYVYKGQTRFTSGSNQAYTVPAGVRAIRVRIVGGGGGAGGPNNTAAGEAAAGSGGSAGGYSERFITDLAQLALEFRYTVGTGGAGGAVGNNGAAGVTTTFANTVAGGAINMSANGGGLGGFMASGTTVNIVTGGHGGEGSGGDINLQGGPGGPSIRLSGTVALSGSGGQSPLGGAGARGLDVTTGGIDSTSPGAGGHGSGGINGGDGGAGGDGAAGIVIIDEFY